MNTLRLFKPALFLLSASLLLACGERSSNASGKQTETPSPADVQAQVVARAGAPFLDGMGVHQHPITTSDPWAQKYFNQGLIIDFAFNHAESIPQLRDIIERFFSPDRDQSAVPSVVSIS